MDNVHVFPDLDALIHATAERIVGVADRAITARGRFCIGLSGGSTPRPLFDLLASEQFAGRIDWPNVFVFWGDERNVSPDSAESNYRMARDTLLAHVPLPTDNVKRIKGELDPAQAAEMYEHTLRMFFSAAAWPRFDLLLQGMGDDGHTASLFPGTEALKEQSRWVVANYVPKLEAWRITLTAPAVNAAEEVIFLVAGANKAEALHAVLRGPYQPETYPSQLIHPQDGRLVWMIDEAAASEL